MIEALSLYREKNIDFTDALLAQFALNQGTSLFFSFDNHFSRIPGIMKMKPGNLPD
jgi:predicted nucleic-acid-binding protein